jgi:hypothetical protein
MMKMGLGKVMELMGEGEWMLNCEVSSKQGD